MEGGERQVSYTQDVSGDRRQAFQGFVESVEEHVSAIQSAARERLAQIQSNDPESGEVRVAISVGPNAPPPPAEAEADADVWCGTVTVPCGKSRTGYIYCTITYCETTGPVTVSR